jgi:hypothetical protein
MEEKTEFITSPLESSSNFVKCDSVAVKEHIFMKMEGGETSFHVFPE